jgi:hypothetical protein
MKKINKNIITLHYDKTNLGILSVFYKKKIRKQYNIDIIFFYWLYRKVYDRNIKGFCIKKTNNIYNNMESFTIYYKYRNVKVNQIYFNSSPFNLLLKYKVSYSNYRLYVL